jgi:hypothetical protein
MLSLHEIAACGKKEVGIIFRVEVKDAPMVMLFLEQNSFHWANGQKPTDISVTAYWVAPYGYLYLKDSTVYQSSECNTSRLFPEEITLMLESTGISNTRAVQTTSTYCSCGGPTKHIQYTSFEYDVCTQCKLEKK